jgi:hypothetical protein
MNVGPEMLERLIAVKEDIDGSSLEDRDELLEDLLLCAWPTPGAQDA